MEHSHRFWTTVSVRRQRKLVASSAVQRGLPGAAVVMVVSFSLRSARAAQRHLADPLVVACRSLPGSGHNLGRRWGKIRQLRAPCNARSQLASSGGIRLRVATAGGVAIPASAVGGRARTRVTHRVAPGRIGQP